MLTTEKIIEIFIESVPILVAVLPVVFTYYFAKKREMEQRENEIKKEFYSRYMEAVSNFAMHSGSLRANEEFANESNKVLLFGNGKVVEASMDLRDFVMKVSDRSEEDREKMTAKEKEDEERERSEKLTALMTALRKDLYGREDINDGYPNIEFTGVGSKHRVKDMSLDKARHTAKERSYFRYMEALSNVCINGDSHGEKKELADAINQMFLVCNGDVAAKLLRFHECINRSGNENTNEAFLQELFTDLVKSMRIDLYGERDVNNEWPTIRFFGG